MTRNNEKKRRKKKSNKNKITLKSTEKEEKS